MIAHVTAAALASENKTLAHPASIDSIPTSAGQEDHVSMATWAGRKLLGITENVAGILAIELLAAAAALLWWAVSRLVALNFGRVIAEGDPREVMASAPVREVYLGSPV